MDNHETLTDAVETPATVAEVAPVEEIVSGFSLLDILEIYDTGAAKLARSDLQRWRETLSISVVCRGLIATRGEAGFQKIMVVWPTKNPHVNLAREVPKADPEGNYLYFGWNWGGGGSHFISRLRAHIATTFPSVEFLAWHDARKRLKRKQRGRLWVKRFDSETMAMADELIAARNGNATRED